MAVTMVEMMAMTTMAMMIIQMNHRMNLACSTTLHLRQDNWNYTNGCLQISSSKWKNGNAATLLTFVKQKMYGLVNAHRPKQCFQFGKIKVG